MNKKNFKIIIVLVAILFIILVAVASIKFPESKKILEKGMENSCFTYEGEEELTITGYRYNTCGENVKIPSSINNKKITKIASYAFRSNGITSVEIPDSVVLIGDFAFYDNSLTSVDLPEKLVEIGYGAFETNKLKNIVLPDSVERIGHYAFYDNDIEVFTIGKNVKEINLFALSKNKNLKTVVIKQEKGKLDVGSFGENVEIIYTN